jgi:DNA-binding transcriptional MerR regulator
MTVEELAEASGLTVRNIREYQTRGLIPPPELEGRKGFYREQHLVRLRLIRDLQHEGLNLQGIGWLLERAPAEATEEVARFERILFAPWTEEEPVVLRTQELTHQLGTVPGSEVRRAIDLDIVRPLGDDRWEVPSPRLIEAGAALVELGIPVRVALDTVERLIGISQDVAQVFVDLFDEEVWNPFADEGHPAGRWREVREALERLRPIAGRTLLAIFQREMGVSIREHWRP